MKKREKPIWNRSWQSLDIIIAWSSKFTIFSELSIFNFEEGRVWILLGPAARISFHCWISCCCFNFQPRFRFKQLNILIHWILWNSFQRKASNAYAQNDWCIHLTYKMFFFCIYKYKKNLPVKLSVKHWKHKKTHERYTDWCHW